VSVFGDGATWTVYINKTCTDTFYHWTSETELTNCVTYVRGFWLFVDLTKSLSGPLHCCILVLEKIVTKRELSIANIHRMKKSVLTGYSLLA